MCVFKDVLLNFVLNSFRILTSASRRAHAHASSISPLNGHFLSPVRSRYCLAWGACFLVAACVSPNNARFVGARLQRAGFVVNI